MTLRRGRIRIGWFSSVHGAIVGACFGLVIFLVSVGLLWWNEGRVNLANLARSAAIADPDHTDRALDHRLVSVTSLATTDRPATDPTFLAPRDAIALSRRAEMFAWIERSTGSERTYVQEWAVHPPDSRRFREPRGHDNPRMKHRSEHFIAPSGQIGAYHFVPAAAVLPNGVPLLPTREILRPGAPDGARIEGKFIYLGHGALARPSVGDLRLSYVAYRQGALATLFGEQDAASIRVHHEGATQFHRLVAGARESAIAALALEHRAVCWMLRIVGFALVWLALNLALAPISAMFDLIPSLGGATRSIVAAATLPPALAISLATVLMSATAHSPLAMAFVVAGALVIAGVWLARRATR